MFKWIATIFAPSIKVAEKEATQKLSDVAPAKMTIKKDLAIPAGQVKKVVKEVEVKTEKVTKASLSKLTKIKLEEFALVTYGVDIDRRKKKEDLVKEVLKLSKKV
jgi:BMFP domain-containing protein YqiC